MEKDKLIDYLKNSLAPDYTVQEHIDSSNNAEWVVFGNVFIVDKNDFTIENIWKQTLSYKTTAELLAIKPMEKPIEMCKRIISILTVLERNIKINNITDETTI